MAYTVSSKEEKAFIPAPEGEHNAVCIDIVDLGYQEGFEGKSRHMFRMVFELEALTEDGTRFTASSRYSVSLHENSNLRKDLEKWRGKAFGPGETDGFDLEKLIGVSARVFISHNTNKEGKVFGNIDSIVRAKIALKPAPDYIRRKHRDDWVPPKNSPWNKPAKANPQSEPELMEAPSF